MLLVDCESEFVIRLDHYPCCGPSRQKVFRLEYRRRTSNTQSFRNEERFQERVSITNCL